MANAPTSEAATPEGDAAPPKKKRKLGLLLALVGVPLVLGGGGGGAYFLVPGVAEKVAGLTAAKEEAPPVPTAPRPVFVDLAEMSVTLPNSGQSRQLRIRISLELMKTSAELPPTDLLTPRVYDALLTYLRTLSDNDIDNAMAIDRIRGDLYRRLNLLLGTDVVRDVLVTSLVVA